MESLYKKEQKLLKELVIAEKEKDHEYQAVLKRQIARINKELKDLDN